MQHVEEAGVHSGDSACVLPPLSLGEDMQEEVRGQTREIALGLGVIGLMNVQFGLSTTTGLYVIEANPARIAHGAVRLEGDRRAAREGGLPPDPR